MRALLDWRGSLVPCAAAAGTDDSLWMVKVRFLPAFPTSEGSNDVICAPTL